MDELKQDVQVQLVVEEGRLSDIVKKVEVAGGNVGGEPLNFIPPVDEMDDYSDQQFEPLTVIAVTLGVGALVRMIYNMWMDKKRPGGQIIDARTKPPTSRPAPFLNRGMLVIITADGSTVYEPKQRNEAMEAIKAVFGA